MRLFPGMSETELVMAGIASIGLACAWWLQFWPGYREKLRVRRQRQLGELETLRVRLRDDIAPWASNEWDDGSHSPDWYDPAFHVNAYNWEFVERFNRVVMGGEYPRALTAGLTKIEELSRRFHESLAEQDRFRNVAANDVVHCVHRIVTASRAVGRPLTDEGIAAAVPDLRPEGRAWVQELYQRNRRIHAQGIGRVGQADGLHEAWRSATQELERVRRNLQAGKDPAMAWVGHSLAAVFAILGLAFLIGFAGTLLPGKSASPSGRLGPGQSAIAQDSSRADTANVARPGSEDGRGLAGSEAKEMWSLDHQARIACLVSAAPHQDSLIVINLGYPVRRMRVERVVFLDVRPYSKPTDAKFVRYLMDDYYKDQLDGDYEGSQRVVYGSRPGNLAFAAALSKGLQDSLLARGFNWAGIEITRAIRVVYWDLVGKRMDVHFVNTDYAGEASAPMKSIGRREWESLSGAADSVRKSGRILLCGTRAPESDRRKVIRECTEAAAK